MVSGGGPGGINQSEGRNSMLNSSASVRQSGTDLGMSYRSEGLPVIDEGDEDFTTRTSMVKRRNSKAGCGRSCNECYLSFAVLVRYVAADLSRKKSAF